MKQIILAVIILLSANICWAQVKPVSNYWAFSKPVAYGKELVDLEENPVPRADTAYFVYLETKQGIQPKIQSVNFKGVKWHASVHPVPELNIEAGTHQQTGKKVVIRRKPQYYLWRAELSPSHK